MSRETISCQPQQSSPVDAYPAIHPDQPLSPGFIPISVGNTREHAIAHYTAYSCVVCSAAFQTNHQLEEHSSATQHRAFQCTCGTTFGRLSTLRRHVASNTGARHPCHLCEKRFPRRDKLYDHLRDGHKLSARALKAVQNHVNNSLRGSQSTIVTRTASTLLPSLVATWSLTESSPETFDRGFSDSAPSGASHSETAIVTVSTGWLLF